MLLTWTASHVPAAIVPVAGRLAVGVVPTPRPKKFRVQLPDWARVPYGSEEVFDTAIPVSNPGSVLTNGNSSTVLHCATLISVDDVDGGTKRGIGEPVPPAVAVVGAK